MAVPTVVITSAVNWNGIVARPQHISRLLALRGWNVLFVDGPVTLISPLKNPSLRNRLLPSPPVRELHVPSGQGRLRVLSPAAQIPFGNMYRSINRLNQRMLAAQIQSAAEGPYVLLSMLPNSVDLIPHLHPVTVLYDCVDFHAEFPGFVKKDVVNQMEADLAALSRTVFTTAEALENRMRELHSDVRRVANAAEVEHFCAAREATLHPLLEDIPSPRAGFIGGIGSWVDLDWIAALADARKDLQIVLVGPIETDVSRLNGLHNVHLLGRQPYADLPRFLTGFDVTLMVFRVDSKVAQSVNPVKVYEYLAADQEVIATPIPEMKALEDIVWLAETGNDAAVAVDAILGGARRQQDEALRGEFVRDNSWSARVNAIERALLAALPENARLAERQDA